MIKELLTYRDLGEDYEPAKLDGRPLHFHDESTPFQGNSVAYQVELEAINDIADLAGYSDIESLYVDMGSQSLPLLLEALPQLSNLRVLWLGCFEHTDLSAVLNAAPSLEKFYASDGTFNSAIRHTSLTHFEWFEKNPSSLALTSFPNLTAFIGEYINDELISVLNQQQYSALQHLGFDVENGVANLAAYQAPMSLCSLALSQMDIHGLKQLTQQVPWVSQLTHLALPSLGAETTIADYVSTKYFPTLQHLAITTVDTYVSLDISYILADLVLPPHACLDLSRCRLTEENLPAFADMPIFKNIGFLQLDQNYLGDVRDELATILTVPYSVDNQFLLDDLDNLDYE